MSISSMDSNPSDVNRRIIHFDSGLAAGLGVDATLLLSQLLWWNKVKPHPDGFWHSLAQWQAELGCDWSRRRHTRALRKLVGAGVLKCTHRDGRETRYLPNLPAIEKLRRKLSTAVDFRETLLKPSRVSTGEVVIDVRADVVSSDTTPNLTGDPVQIAQGAEKTLYESHRVASNPVQIAQGLPEKQKIEEKHQTEKQPERVADAAPFLVGEGRGTATGSPPPNLQPTSPGTGLAGFHSTVIGMIYDHLIDQSQPRPRQVGHPTLPADQVPPPHVDQPPHLKLTAHVGLPLMKQQPGQPSTNFRNTPDGRQMLEELAALPKPKDPINMGEDFDISRAARLYEEAWIRREQART